MFDERLTPREGDLVLYRTPGGAERASTVFCDEGELHFDVAGIPARLARVTVLGVGVDFRSDG